MTETQTGVRSTRWIWIAAMWVAGALFEAGQSVPFMRAMGKQHAWLIFGTELASWVPWALATPLVIGLARRYEIIRATTIQATAVHFAAFAIISLVAEAWFAVLQEWRRVRGRIEIQSSTAVEPTLSQAPSGSHRRVSVRRIGKQLMLDESLATARPRTM